MQKDLETLGVKIVDGGHPLSLLDSNPIIVKTQVYLIQFQLLMKHINEALKF